MPDSPANVVVFDHPLIQHKLTWLRERSTSSRAFRALMTQIAGLMVYEVTRQFPHAPVEIDTPLTSEMFDQASCNTLYGGHFSVTREQIRNMPVEVYQGLKEQQTHANEEVDHVIERSWATMFCTSLHAAPASPAV